MAHVTELSSEVEITECKRIVRDVVDRHQYIPEIRTSERILTKSLETELFSAGFVVDVKDKHQMLLPPRVSVWRSGESLDETILRREIDMVIYRDNRLVALLESEEDLKHIKRDGSDLRG